MNKYEISTTMLSELTIEEVEDLLTEFINDKIGYAISGRGEVLPIVKFETIHNNKYNKCVKIYGNSRPRCMNLSGDNCTSASGCCFN